MKSDRLSALTPRLSRRLFATGVVLSVGVASQAAAQPRATAVVARIIVDPALTIPPGFETTLRRELELALAGTGLFYIPTRDAAELNRVLDEVERTRGRGAPAQSVDTVIAPTITAIELTERRRPAPYQQGRDLITISGSISLQITVMNQRDASVVTRFPLQATYRDEGRLVDRSWSAPAGTQTANANAYVLLAREAGRALAEHVRARNPSTTSTAAAILVVERDGNRVFLSPPSGLHVGAELRVFAPGGREIRHPQTNELLGTVEQEIGRLRVVELMPRLALAEIVSSSAEIEAGASARLQ
ncbi:hypothetical protein [Terricaulis sp.]|uniref:hypothetical protein n=1 Tax=Terricaulis sp. TaxID=2768686 RepID=UPI002ADDC8A3|nr:hypothetical protein [Terricaulis sp.]